MWKTKAKFIKWSLNLFNLLIFLTGAALVSVGVLLQTTFKYEHAIFSSHLNIFSISLLTAGIMLVGLAIVGCVSLLPSCVNSLMVAFFIIGLMIVSIGLASLGGYFYANFNDENFANDIKTEMNTTFNFYKEKYTHLEETIEMDLLQTKFKCCGLNSYKDWQPKYQKNSLAFNKNEMLLYAEQIPFDLPDSCCINYTINCGKDFRFLDTINKSGCFEPFFKHISNYILFMCSIANGLAIINILTISFLIFVCLTLKGDYSLINSYDNSEIINEKEQESIDQL